MLHQNPVVSDLIATGLSGTIALSFLRSFEETAKRHIFDQVLIYLLSLSRNFYKT
jgi:farnesol kinase